MGAALAGEEIGLTVRGPDLFLAGLRAMGIPHRIHRRPGCGFVVLVAAEDAVPAGVILRRVNSATG
jgi:hypothetical protein